MKDNIKVTENLHVENVSDDKNIESPTTTTTISENFNSKQHAKEMADSFFGWIKIDYKDSNSLLKKLLSMASDSRDTNNNDDDHEKSNSNDGDKFTADIVIQTSNASSASLNNKLFALLQSETRQFTVNENLNDEIVIDSHIVSTTSVMLTNTTVNIVTDEINNTEEPTTITTTTTTTTTEATTMATNKEEIKNITTTQSTTIVSSGKNSLFFVLLNFSFKYSKYFPLVNPQFVECVNACGIDHDCVRTKCVIDSTYFG